MVPWFFLYSSGQIERTISECVTLLMDINQVPANLIDVSPTNFSVSSAFRGEDGFLSTDRISVSLVSK